MRRLPWVGLPTDSTVLGHHRFAVAGEKYVRALAEAAEVTPVLLPSMQPPLPASDWLQGLDGLLLTGAVSNIEPQHYDGGRSWPGNPHDPARDANAFALLHEALALDLPVLAICR
ncbi:gamma-glutamyl-gamma-aminobutyrate hydrolase, partial [Stenotrophomonas maltophilia]